MKAKTGGNFSVIAKNKNKSNLIKIICVIIGAVFAFTTSIVYGAFSWKREHNSGYATGAFLPNQTYQIINDTLPNGILYSDGVKEYEVALQYSYDYAFNFYVEYELNWSNGLDASNVILNFSNRNAWIVDNSRIYYRDTVAAGTGKLPIIVGVDFVDNYNSNYYGAKLTINIKKVEIAKTNESLDQTGIAGAAYAQYQARKLASYSTANAYAVVYNPTNKGSYQPKAPVGKTAFETKTSTSGSTSVTTTSKLFGNKNYVGLGAYVITGSSPINLVAKVIGSWVVDTGKTTDPSSANINTNTIKYNYSSGWIGESYDVGTIVQEIRTFQYTIPAHTAMYIDIIDSVEMITRGMLAAANYTDFHIETDLLLNSDTQLNFENGLATSTITTKTLSGTSYSTNLPTQDYSVVNSSKYDAALYNVTTGGAQTYKTQIKVINNTASKMSVSASYTLKAYISNGNSTADYQPAAGSTTPKDGNPFEFDDESHWDRDEYSYTSSITVGAHNASQVIAPYSAMTICTSFTVPNDMVAKLVAAKAAYSGKDVWIELVPTITTATSTAADTQLVLETVVSGTTAKLYAKNVSSNALTSLSLNLKYSRYSTQANMTSTTLSTEPANWKKEYWKYYVSNSGSYKQVNEVNNPTSNSDGSTSIKTASMPTFAAGTYYTNSGWIGANAYTTTSSAIVNPGEKVLLGSLTITASQTYDFSDYTLTGSVTTASDVNLVNETTGSAFIKNNSTTKSYYIRFSSSASFADTTKSNFFQDGSFWYLYGLIRPGQVIPINITAVDSQISIEAVEDTTGSLPTQISTWPTTVVEKLKTMYN